MKKIRMLLVSMLILATIGISITEARVISTPYVCPKCGDSFMIEGALVNHMKYFHDIDYQISGELPEYNFRTVGYEKYTPVPYYVCPLTGKCFYTEPQLVCWLDSIS